MKVKQVIEFYKDKKDRPCPITKSLIEAGWHQQFNTHYLEGIYSIKDIPHQYDHLMKFCNYKLKTVGEDANYPYTPCGELLFWMAETSGVVDKEELKKLVNSIIGHLSETKQVKRREWQLEINRICYYPIKSKIESGL